MIDNNSVEVFLPNIPKPVIIDITDMHMVMSIKNQVHIEGSGNGSLRVHYKGMGLTSVSHIVLFGRKRNDVYIDHANRDIYDNRRNNLRICSNSQNQQNKPKTSKKTSSRFLGINAFKNKWQARLTVNGVRIFIGSFDNEIDAAKARDKAALKYYGEFAILNFPKAQADIGPAKKETTGLSSPDATNLEGTK